jgi:hypothetical protein
MNIGPFEYILRLEENGIWVSMGRIKYIIYHWNEFVENMTSDGSKVNYV